MRSGVYGCDDAVRQCCTDAEARRVGCVLCSDGASRCGLYTAASYMLDKSQHDNEVDVLLSCRYVIAGRPTAIPSLVSPPHRKGTHCLAGLVDCET